MFLVLWERHQIGLWKKCMWACLLFQIMDSATGIHYLKTRINKRPSMRGTSWTTKNCPIQNIQSVPTEKDPVSCHTVVRITTAQHSTDIAIIFWCWFLNTGVTPEPNTQRLPSRSAINISWYTKLSLFFGIYIHISIHTYIIYISHTHIYGVSIITYFAILSLRKMSYLNEALKQNFRI